MRLALDLEQLKFDQHLDTTYLSCTGQRGKFCIAEVMCNRGSIMLDDESLSLGVRVFMTEKEALWYEFEHSFSQ